MIGGRKVIDGHLHTKYFPENWFIECADKRGYDGYAVLSLSCMKSWGGEKNNEQCLAAKRADPKRCYLFSGLVHPCEDYKAHVENWLKEGADGIKLIETKPTVQKETGVDLSDEKFDEMFSYLEETGTPILWHCGDPATFWNGDKVPDWAVENGWFYGDGSYKSLPELYGMVEKVLQKHPKLWVCLAHLYFCGDDRKHAEDLLDTYQNVRLDITPGVEMYDSFTEDHDGWHDFFMKYQDRIQLGSDTDMGNDLNAENAFNLAYKALGKVEFDWNQMHVKGLDLPEPVIDKVVYKNFRAFAGETPKGIG